MKKIYILFALAFCILASGNEAEAQRRDNYRGDISKFRGFKKRFPKQSKYFSLGVTVNALNYFGDLAPKSGIFSTDISLTRPGFGLVGSYRMGERFSMRGSFTYGRIYGDDSEAADPTGEESVYRYVRNLHFRNDVKELAVTAVFDLYKHRRSYISRVEFTPYVFGGLAVMHHNPKAQVPDAYNGPEAGKWVDLEPLGTEGQYVEGAGVDKYSKIQIAIPLGIGVRYKLSQDFDLAFEVGYRHLFFDHLDDVGGNYIDKNRLGGVGSLAAVMSDGSTRLTDAQDLDKIQAPRMHDSSHGASYLVIPGYGHENGEGVLPNVRGNSKDNDIYIVTSIQLNYVFGARNFKRAKFR